MIQKNLEGGDSIEMPPNLVAAVAAQSPKNERPAEDANAKGADDNLAFEGQNKTPIQKSAAADS